MGSERDTIRSVQLIFAVRLIIRVRVEYGKISSRVEFS